MIVHMILWFFYQEAACNGTAQLDCLGECGGTAEIDVCGACNGDGLNDDGCCYDLEPDCNGNCGGNAVIGCDGECGSAQYDCIWS